MRAWARPVPVKSVRFGNGGDPQKEPEGKGGLVCCAIVHSSPRMTVYWQMLHLCKPHHQVYFRFPKKTNADMVGNNGHPKIGMSMRPNGQWTIDCGSIQAQAGGNVGSESSNDMDGTSSLENKPSYTLLMTLLQSLPEDLHHGSSPWRAFKIGGSTDESSKC